MKRQFILAALLFGMYLMPDGVYAQQFTSTANPTTAGFAAPAVNNIYLANKQTNNNDYQQSSFYNNTSFGGSVLSEKSFTSRHSSKSIAGSAADNAAGGTIVNYKSIASISAYQQLGVGSSNIGSPRRGGTPPPPPPTPDIDEEDAGHKLPVGNGMWILLLLTATYAVFRKTVRRTDK